MNPKFLTTFEARTALDTPQIVISWEFDDQWWALVRRFTIRMSPHGWPTNLSEGAIVFTASPSETTKANELAVVPPVIEPERIYYFTMFVEWRDDVLAQEYFRTLGILEGGSPITRHFAFPESYAGRVVGIVNLADPPITSRDTLAIATVSPSGDSFVLFWEIATGFVIAEMNVTPVLNAGDRISSIAWCGQLSSSPAQVIFTTEQRELIHLTYPSDTGSPNLPSEDPALGDVNYRLDLTEIFGEELYGPGAVFTDFTTDDSAIEFADKASWGGVPVSYVILDRRRRYVYRVLYGGGSPTIFRVELDYREDMTGTNPYSVTLSNEYIQPGTAKVVIKASGVVVAVDNRSGSFLGRNGYIVTGGSINYDAAAGIDSLEFDPTHAPNPGDTLEVVYAPYKYDGLSWSHDGADGSLVVSGQQRLEDRLRNFVMQFGDDENNLTDATPTFTYIAAVPVALFAFPISTDAYRYSVIEEGGLISIWVPDSALTINRVSVWTNHRTHAYSGLKHEGRDFSLKWDAIGFLSEAFRSLDRTSTLGLPSKMLGTAPYGERLHLTDGFVGTQTERLMRLLGMLLDRHRGLIEWYWNHFDLRTCDPKWLTSLAYRYGIADLNPDWPMSKQRVYMELRPLINQRKGTLRAIEQLMKFYGFELATASTSIIIGRETFDSGIDFDLGGILDTFGELFEVQVILRLRRISDGAELPAADPMVEFLLGKINKIKTYNVTVRYE